MVRTEDIFLAETKDFNGNIRKHYYYCIYSQNEDENHNLTGDVIGLLITTNKKMENIIKSKNDYNVKIKLYQTESYVCCDKPVRFSEEEIMSIKGDLLDEFEKKLVLKRYSKFINETYRQLGVKQNVKRNNQINRDTKSSI